MFLKNALCLRLTILIIPIYSVFLFSCQNDHDDDLGIQPLEEDYDDFPGEEGKDIIWVSNVDELMQTVQSTKEGNKLVIIKDGTYVVKDRLWLTGDNLIFRSESGDREKVVLKGNGMDGNIGFIFSIAGNNFALKDVSVGEVRNHGIQIHGEFNADNMHVQNVRFFNIREQMIKGTRDRNNTYENHTDSCIVENCLFEYTEGYAFQYYCGGIDVHHGVDWQIRNCTFRNIRTANNQLTEGAIHFWSNSENTLCENNTIYNCDRGIMYGLDNSTHKGGIIRNNMIHVTKDVGIYLCYATGAKVYNNSIFNDSAYPNSIEYRFPETKDCEIINNLTNKPITQRNNGQAEVDNNVVNALDFWFVNPAIGDLHLKVLPTEVIDKALDLADVPKDFDGDERAEGTSDIGADEK